MSRHLKRPSIYDLFSDFDLAHSSHGQWALQSVQSWSMLTYADMLLF
jgi:hypothetical protein